MEKTVKINFRDLVTNEYPVGTSLKEVSKDFKKYFNYPILAAKMDNNLFSLSHTIHKKHDIDFYDRSSEVGNSIYNSSLQLLLVVAIKKVFGSNVDVIVEHSIDKGVYCELLNMTLEKSDIKKIEDKMHELVLQNLVYHKVSVSRIDAIKYFNSRKQYDKVNVLKYISNSYVNLYRLDDIYDYFFGELANNTGDIDDFKLTYIKGNGFVLSSPTVSNPECTLDYVHHKLMFESFLEYTEWGRKVGIATASDLNSIVSNGKYDEIIRLSEVYYENQLSHVSDVIYKNKNEIKFILIAGPSSSGKTTTAKKLEVYLASRGFTTHSISIDDYFLEREQTPKDANGEYDFEGVDAIDIELFNQHLAKLLDGERVLLPQYNFLTGRKEYKNKYIQIGEKDVVVIEGLHALNDKLTMSIERKNKYKIYVCPLTQLNIDRHNRVHTSDTRRLRRIVRDNKYRGYSAAATLKMWKKIREGEEKHIFPFQNDADIVINTAMLYEIGVLKIYAEPLLFSVPEDDESYPEAIRLINFLRNFLPIPSDNIPRESLLREFIGGGCFND
ncbi:MAG: nucleoside kinase [Bacilli bacterium]|nr:nucleoside kinase [Bacilli bacterium]MDD4608107.1 nucleoside kinase [Bacilli bacterium]